MKTACLRCFGDLQARASAGVADFTGATSTTDGFRALASLPPLARSNV
ncbi:MAG: hypothetical protein IPI26_07835 [Elusimicrobia bacterium]|nr:hypothetical protein [Elusimicrobiota bacterium]